VTEMTGVLDAPADAAVAAVGLRKVYGDGPTSVVALDGVDVTFRRGEFAAIMGRPGPGSPPCCTASPASTRSTPGRSSSAAPT
jgi:putative ABC transport system ATP-binding protein